jgi:hypothetical protein
VGIVSASIGTKSRRQPAKKTRKPTEADLEAWEAGEISAVEAAQRGITEAKKKVLADKAKSAEAADIGPDSPGETTRKDALIDQLQAELRQREIRIVGLESEIAELNKEREPASAARCQICREKKPAVQRRVFVCDFCAEIHELKTAEAAAPPADDGLDIPPSLDRRGGATKVPGPLDRTTTTKGGAA